MRIILKDKIVCPQPYSLLFHQYQLYFKKLLKLIFIIFIISSTHIYICAQPDSIASVFNDAIENTVSSNEDLSFDYDTEFEYLQDFIRHPLNINKASTQEFEALKLLTAENIQKIITHREKRGYYMTLYELQSVLDLNTIHRILPFITVDGTLDDFQIPFQEWFKKGKKDFFIKTERRLETSKGFEKANTEGGYVGDAQKLYMRYRYSFGKHLSYGLTIEKDAGEKWSAKPDFTSFHIKIGSLNRQIKTLALGDYAISLGQGLIHENGFALGKSSLVLSIEKNAPPIKAYTSSNEANFMRGIALEYIVAPHTEGVLFASYRSKDGNKIYPNSNDSLNNSIFISSLQTSGFHRTKNEIEDKNAAQLITLGGRISQKIKRGSINFNTVFNHFNKKLEPANELYNLHTFRGTTLLNASLDYKYTVSNTHFFGETAMSHNLGLATSNGVLVGLHKKLSIGILHRYFTLKYQSINAQPLAESSKPNDEIGTYTGINFKANKHWILDAYTDFWRHRWLRFRVDAPSAGREFFIKTTYKSKMTEGYIHARLKTKQENSSRPDSAKLNNVIDKTKSQIRLHIQHKISHSVTLRNRLEWSFYNDTQLSKGFMIYQDVILKYKIMHKNQNNTPLSITARIAYFDTQNYDSAIFAYENDLTYNFTVQPYYYRGARFYINTSINLNKNCQIELRLARTQLTNRNTIGSGLDEIKSPHRTDIKAQIHFEF